MPRLLYPVAHWIGGWVGPTAGLHDVEEKKSRPYRDSNSDPSAVQPVASRYNNNNDIALGAVRG
jgi:hypothetical protein